MPSLQPFFQPQTPQYICSPEIPAKLPPGIDLQTAFHSITAASLCPPQTNLQGWSPGPSYYKRCKKGSFCFSLLFRLHFHWPTISKLNPISPLEGSVVVVCVLFFCFLPFPFPFSAFVAHLLQSTSQQELKLNKFPICHASLVVCSPHHHLAYLLSQERERQGEREGEGENKEGGGGKQRKGGREEEKRREGRRARLGAGK